MKPKPKPNFVVKDGIVTETTGYWQWCPRCGMWNNPKRRRCAGCHPYLQWDALQLLWYRLCVRFFRWKIRRDIKKGKVPMVTFTYEADGSIARIDYGVMLKAMRNIR
jgi:hypothetical protein